MTKSSILLVNRHLSLRWSKLPSHHVKSALVEAPKIKSGQVKTSKAKARQVKIFKVKAVQSKSPQVHYEDPGGKRMKMNKLVITNYNIYISKTSLSFMEIKNFKCFIS